MKPNFNKDYTLRKEFPLTPEQNEVVDFMIHKNKCVNACQTRLSAEKLNYSNLDVVALIPQKAVKAFTRELDEKLKIKYNLISSQGDIHMDRS